MLNKDIIRHDFETFFLENSLTFHVLSYHVNGLIKGNRCISKGGSSMKIVLSSFLKGAYSKRKEFAPCFPWEQILSFFSRPLFQEGLGVQEIKQEVSKVVSLGGSSKIKSPSCQALFYKINKKTML